MSDIVERLRALAPTVEDRLDNDEAGDALLVAASEIDRLRALNAEMEGALDALLGIVNDSQGVAGYHLNGDVATWGEFEEVQAARAILAKAEGGSDA